MSPVLAHNPMVSMIIFSLTLLSKSDSCRFPLAISNLQRLCRLSLLLKDVSLTHLAKIRCRLFALRQGFDLLEVSDRPAKLEPKRRVTEYWPSESPLTPLARDRPAQIVLSLTSLAETSPAIVSQKYHPFWPLTLW